MNRDPSEVVWASDAQGRLCRSLFRRVKVYYRGISDDARLRDEVFKRTGFDLDNLEAEDAASIIGKLEKEVVRNPFRGRRRRF